MAGSIGRIKVGLMRLKRLLGSHSGPASNVQNVQLSPYQTTYSNIPAAPEVFYMNHAVASRRASLAPPPASLPSLASTLTVDLNSTDTQIEEFMETVATEEEVVETQPSGLLGVLQDLQAYEEFIQGEADMREIPMDPVGLRGLQRSEYYLERDASAHVAGALIRRLLEYWKLHYLRANSPKKFSEFLIKISEQDLKLVWGTQDSTATHEVIRRFKQGVRFLEEEKRDKCRVKSSVSGTLYWEKWGNSRPLDTTGADFYKRKHEHLAFTADNVAIWVLSSEDQLYTHAAKVHRFHHSSFLNGNAVKCAGDWEVKDGKLIWISPSSGHYRPTFDNLFETVKVLANKFGIQATSYKIRVYAWDNQNKKVPVMIPASKLLFDLAAVKNNYLPAD